MSKTMNSKTAAIKALSSIPGIGKSLAADLVNIGIKSIEELQDRDPETLYDLSNAFAGCIQDRCVLYAFRCAVYYANTPAEIRDPGKLKWWNWKDLKKSQRSIALI
jgi:Pathogenicity locus